MVDQQPFFHNVQPPTPIKNTPAPKSAFLFWRERVTGKDLAVLTRQLATTLKAGLLLTESLETIAEDLEHYYLGTVILQINHSIRGGSSFSEALAKHPKVFPSTYIAIVKSGEATGRLDKTMDNLAGYLESSERLREKIKSAVTYPMFIVAFAMLVIGVIVFFLIPKFKETFDSFNAQLPLLTRVVIGVSEFFVQNVIFIFLGIVAMVVLYLTVRNYPVCRKWIDQSKIRIPLIGKNIIHKAIVSRFCRTLGFLQAGGVNLATSLDISAKVVDHTLLMNAIHAVKAKVLSGGKMSEEIKNQGIFPKFVGKMVAVGEKTGQVSQMLTQTADYYENELEHSIQRMTVLLEPVLIVVIGIIVLIVVLALYLPIFHLSTIVR